MSQVIPADLIVSVSGIRGIVGEGLTPAVSTQFAAAFGSYLGGGRVVVSRDSRPSGDMLRHAVTAGLLSAGCSVVNIGIAPTPTCGIAVRKLGAAGCIQISASHNPAPWNGLKMFGPDGAVLTADKGAEVRAIFEIRSSPRKQAGLEGDRRRSACRPTCRKSTLSSFAIKSVCAAICTRRVSAFWSTATPRRRRARWPYC